MKAHTTRDDKKRAKLGYRRRALACAHCRRRKIRCLSNEDESSCQNCKRFNIACHYHAIEHDPGSKSNTSRSSRYAVKSVTSLLSGVSARCTDSADGRLEPKRRMISPPTVAPADGRRFPGRESEAREICQYADTSALLLRQEPEVVHYNPSVPLHSSDHGPQFWPFDSQPCISSKHDREVPLWQARPVIRNTDPIPPIIEDLIVSAPLQPSASLEGAEQHYHWQSLYQHQQPPHLQQPVEFGSPAPSLPSSSGPLTPDWRQQPTQPWQQFVNPGYDYAIAHVYPPPVALPILPSQGRSHQGQVFEHWSPMVSHVMRSGMMGVR